MDFETPNSQLTQLRLTIPNAIVVCLLTIIFSWNHLKMYNAHKERIPKDKRRVVRFGSNHI